MNILEKMSKKLLFSKEDIKIASARDAYMASKYCEILSKEEMIKRVYDTALERIKIRNTYGETSCMLALDYDLEDDIPDIISNFKKKGYNVIRLSENTKVDGKTLTSEVIDGTLLILTWPNIKAIKNNIKEANKEDEKE